MDSDDYLFVYGTLRQDIQNAAHPLLKGRATYIDLGAFHGKLYDLGRYPGAVPARGANDWVVGEIYRLNDSHATLKVLDAYEGRRFRRKPVTVKKHGGQRVTAWIYLYVGPVQQYLRIRSGDYLQYRNSSPG